MVVRCVVALVLMGIVLLIGFSITRRAAARFQHDAELIDGVGRQRMLLILASLLTERLDDATTSGERDQLRQRLRNVSADLMQGHESVRGRRLSQTGSRLSPEVLQVFTSPPHRLDARYDDFLQTLNRLTDEPDQPSSASRDDVARIQAMSLSGELLDAQDAVVQEFTLEIERDHAALLLTNSIVLGCGMLTLLATGIGVFWPMIQRVRNETCRLVQANGVLDEQKQTLSQTLIELEVERESLQREIQSRQRIQEEMKQFVYTVSHDLKSPLVTCKGFVGLMKEDAEEGRWDDMLDSVERVERATERMGDLIDDLLELSRIGAIRNDPEHINVNDVLESVAEDLSKRILDVGAVLSIQEGLPSVVADRIRFVEVFENLLGNAIKYGCRGSRPRIDIGGVSLDGEIRFFVKDNGSGIAPEFHEKVFGLFQRLEADKEGTGVGLAAVARIMEVHGGRVWVESVPDAGATFWVAFPIA